MIVEIRTLETTEGDANRLRISDEGMGANGNVFMVVPIQDVVGKEVGKIEMIVDVAEMKSALMMFASKQSSPHQELKYAIDRVEDYLDAIMQANPDRKSADLANWLEKLKEEL